MRRAFRLVLLTSIVAACAPAPSVGDPTAELLASGADFVEVPKPDRAEVAAGKATLARGQLGSVSGKNDFYIAIRKDVLAQRWFLSGYMKQWFPGDAAVIADVSLGTRVVSFQIQNDKLFVFDTSELHKASAVEDPDILVEAYPIVRYLPFDLLFGSDKYVLIDPSRGLNRVAVTGETFGDPVLAAYGTFPFRVGLAFLQNFRSLPDGVSFEEVFTGDYSTAAGTESAWGTLGIALRRYAEGAGFAARPEPLVPHYFRSDRRILPDTGYQVVANAVKWNIRPGMQPVKFYVTQGVKRAQADYPDVDVIGAVERGIESWNAVFGFPVFEAVFVDDDRVRNDDQSTLLFDYPGAGNPFAFADWRHNPNTGEIRGASVYFGGSFLSALDFYDDDPAPSPSDRPLKRPVVRTLSWGGLPGSRPACVYWSPAFRDARVRLRADRSRTAQEKGALFIQHVVLHEIGHVLGLRHNFAGSLVPPSSSAMDYLDNFTDAVELGTPGQYDIDALRYLYGATNTLPTQPFCTDEQTRQNPLCAVFDSGADPLNDYWSPLYDLVTALVVDIGLPPEFLELGGLNEILGFARDTQYVAPAQRANAVDIALGRTRVPLDPADAADPFVVAQAASMNDFVLRRAALDPPALRGAITRDITDPGAVAALSAQAGAVVRNEDSARPMYLRRTAVDALKRLQATPALLELRASRAALQAALDGETVPPSQVPLVEDLVARIDAALSPYFD